LKIGQFLLVACSLSNGASAACAQGGRNVQPFLAAPAPTAAAAPMTALYVAPAAGQLVLASWYGGGERLGRRTSAGELFRPMGHTAAHRSLPFGTLLRVSSPKTGRSTIVRINDRGPAASTGRALDLSRGAALDLGIAGAGSARVLIEVMR
jgi:rare lipoprotein A (peptidoglycan hydrolase)